MRRWLVGLFVPALAHAAPAKRAPTASPCGVKVLPLAVGNRWTYAFVPAPHAKPSEAVAANSIVITVKRIDAVQGGDAVITLEETTTIAVNKDLRNPVLDERTIETTITCNASKFEISPDSFLFTGDPGGFVGLQLGSVVRTKGTTWPPTFGQAWHEDLTATWTRPPPEGSEATLGSGTIELDRVFTPQRRESVKTKLRGFTATKLGVATTGHITIGAAKPTELPGAVATLWIADGVGLVQAIDSFARTYQLTDVTLK